MKKIIIMLAITLNSAVLFAGEENVNAKILNAFSREFSGARDVKWTSGETFTKASFIFNDSYVDAYYETNGDLVVVTRNISSVDLPMNLQTSLLNGYKGQWLTELVEVSDNTGTHYYASMEDAGSKLILRSTVSGGWRTQNKSVKN